MDKIKKPSDREQFSLRMPLELKEKLELEACSRGYSLNAFILMKLEN